MTSWGVATRVFIITAAAFLPLWTVAATYFADERDSISGVLREWNNASHNALAGFVAVLMTALWIHWFGGCR